MLQGAEVVFLLSLQLKDICPNNSWTMETLPLHTAVLRKPEKYKIKYKY